MSRKRDSKHLSRVGKHTCERAPPCFKQKSSVRGRCFRDGSGKNFGGSRCERRTLERASVAKSFLASCGGRTPTIIAQGGRCAKSQVHRVAERFIAHGLTGLADRREDNGESKVSEFYQTELLRLIDESPQEFGYSRPTWTQELMILVLFERTDVLISVSTMSRLLKRI